MLSFHKCLVATLMPTAYCILSKLATWPNILGFVYEPASFQIKTFVLLFIRNCKNLEIYNKFSTHLQLWLQFELRHIIFIKNSINFSFYVINRVL